MYLLIIFVVIYLIYVVYSFLKFFRNRRSQTDFSPLMDEYLKKVAELESQKGKDAGGGGGGLEGKPDPNE